MDQVFLHGYDEEFLSHISLKKLVIPVDSRTGAAVGYHERARCACEDGSVAWAPASGRALLLSYTVTRRPYAPDFPVPLIHGLVELEEGPQLVCRILDIVPESLSAGLGLMADFDEKGLMFRRAPECDKPT